MKKYILAILCLLSLQSFSQGVDSTRIVDTFHMSKDHMDYLTGVIGERPGANPYKFYKQVTAQVDTANLVDPTKTITVTAEGGFTYEFYVWTSNVKEGVGSKINNEIKAAMLPQIKNQWLINRLMQYNDQLNTELEAIKQRGRNIQKAYH
jgi:hypothetical protein